MSAKLHIPSLGTSVNGTPFGYYNSDLTIKGELVFSTNMVGYPESLSDPSFKDQILVLTYPIIGSYGVPDHIFLESEKPQIAGLIIQELVDHPSHWNSKMSLNQWLETHQIPGIKGVDTRNLTKLIREHGTVASCMTFKSSEELDSNKMETCLLDVGPHPVTKVAISNNVGKVEFHPPAEFESNQRKSHILVIDCGVKKSQINMLFKYGATVVTVVNWNYDFLNDTELYEDFDGLLISNGPGDPSCSELTPLIKRLRTHSDNELKKLHNRARPILGICFGHQLLGLSAGFKTYKMNFGNRGINVPVQLVGSNRALITSQNHGYALDLPVIASAGINDTNEWQPLFVNPHDGSNEGMVHRDYPFCSVQFHPEAGPGPSDSEFLFQLLIENRLNRSDIRTHLTTVKNIDSDIVTKNKKVLILGSGGLSIGQSGEFDYSGSQAIKAYKEEGLTTILVNPNIATVQTSKDLADKTYSIPVQLDYVTKVIITERPDYITISFGGQTALNCGLKLQQNGVLDKYGVKILGSPISSVIKTEDRDIFKDHLTQIGEKAIASQVASTPEDAIAVAQTMGFPLLIRAAYALGGLGSGFAYDQSQLEKLIDTAFSFSNQVIIDKSLAGWKELEYEVVRDRYDNCLCICNMENIDPLGVHTGESMVVAPSQTLDDHDYQMLRTCALKTIRSLDIVGECNIQFALDPHSREYYVIEVNARLSRSSALASKATGYPLAYVAAKLSLGYSLLDIKNSVTGSTSACFEPSLDYCVVKVPRWDLRKFPQVDTTLDSSMKSIGEAMAISRNFEESFQKALRMADNMVLGLMGDHLQMTSTEDDLHRPNHQRAQYLGNALYQGLNVNELYRLTNIDPWFLHKFEKIISTQKEIENIRDSSHLDLDLVVRAKILGFCDKQIARYCGSTEIAIRKQRQEQFHLIPKVKQIDTVAGESPCETNYLYTTYSATTHDIDFDTKTTIVLGSGVYQIGSSVEFDWCCVNAIRELRKKGVHTSVINCNPETVSTDYDEADKLYFDELSFERVMDIYQQEEANGIILSMGGQLPNNISMPLYRQYVNVIGTSPETIDIAENRYKFSRLLDQIGVKQPEWRELQSLDDTIEFCQRVGYPCLIRPSYVLSGAAMNVCYSRDDLEEYLTYATEVSPEHPVVISKYISDAKEVEVDAVASGGLVRVISIAEHIENAGVHSGDSTIVLPPQDLTSLTLKRIKESVNKLVKAMNIKGPFNMQFMVKNDDVQVIECNLRVSRTFPFVSKTLNLNLIAVAIDAMLDHNMIEVPEKLETHHVGIKVPKFSFSRLKGADFNLGVEMVSTGEIACYGRNIHEAYIKAIQASDFKLPVLGSGILVSLGAFKFKSEFIDSAKILEDLGYKLYGTRGTCDYFREHNITITEVDSDTCIEKIGQTSPREMGTQQKEIGLVINVSRNIQHSNSKTLGYLIRRTAIDHSVALITDIKWAKLFVKSLQVFYSEQKGQIWVDTSIDCLTRHRIVRLPGLIDVHVHMREPGGEYKEDWESGTKSAIAGGITAICAMPNTSPAIVDKDSFELVSQLAKNKAHCDYGIFLGANSENTQTVSDLASSQKKEGTTACALKMYLNATYGPLLLESTTDWSEHIKNWNYLDKPICVHAEEKTLGTVLHLANLHQRSIHVCHVARKEEIELIKLSKQCGVKVTCEVAPHHLFLSENDLKSLKSCGEVRPRLMTLEDQNALWENLEWIDCFATDHAPHTLEEKLCQAPPGFPGLETALPLLLTAVKNGRLTLDQIIEKYHTNPKRIFHLPDQGDDTYIEVDLDHQWTIPEKPPFSKAGWTPFAGYDVCGKVCRTVIRGKIVYVDGQILSYPGYGQNLRTTQTDHQLQDNNSTEITPKLKNIETNQITLKIFNDNDNDLIKEPITPSKSTISKIPCKLLEVSQLDRELLSLVFDRADQLRSDKRAGRDLTHILHGKVVGTLFYEPSSRTKSSFISAVHRLGGQTVDLNIDTSSVQKGESFLDTVKTLECYSDCLIVRTNQTQREQLRSLQSQIKIPIINAGDGNHEHPTQAILDIYTIRNERGTVNGLTICLIGDLENGRTAHSLVKLLTLYQNIKLRYVPVTGLNMPLNIQEFLTEQGVQQTTHQSLDEVIEDIDVLYCTRIQSERILNQVDVSSSYQVTVKQLNRAKDNLVVMHPLPRVNEISPELDDDPRAAYFRQMKNGLYIRMVLLEMLLT